MAAENSGKGTGSVVRHTGFSLPCLLSDLEQVSLSSGLFICKMGKNAHRVFTSSKHLFIPHKFWCRAVYWAPHKTQYLPSWGSQSSGDTGRKQELKQSVASALKEENTGCVQSQEAQSHLLQSLEEGGSSAEDGWNRVGVRYMDA